MFAAILATLSLAAPAAEPQTVGGCVWSGLAEADRQTILSEYTVGIMRAMNGLSGRDEDLRSKAQECVGRSDTPPLWLRASIAAHVIQLGASQEIRSARSIERHRLDAAWASAPPEARDCVLSNASKPFGVTGPACSNPRAPEALLSAIGLSLSRPADRSAAEQSLIYMNVKAQEEIAESLIQRMQSSAPDPAIP